MGTTEIVGEVDRLLQEFDRALTREDRVRIRKRLREIKDMFPVHAPLKHEVWTRGEYLISQYPALLQLPTDKYYQLHPHQTFLKKWVSPDTRNRSILLFHSVGVGKTCTAIQIAENFKGLRAGKSELLKLPMIVVIRPKTLEGNFKTQLYDPATRDADGEHLLQCTGDTYDPADHRLLSNEECERRAMRLIGKVYDEYAPGKFANDVEKIAGDRHAIAKEFSDRVIIVDEVHKLRLSSDTQEKKVVDMLTLIATHAKGVKLILLSATPMFNRADEIWDLMHLLYLNDGVPFEKTGELFDEQGVITPAASAQIGDFASRYVSFMRGDNPATFPARLYPSATGVAHRLKPEQYPLLTPSGKPIPEHEQIRYTELIKCNMSAWQMHVYRQTMASADEDTDTDPDAMGEGDDEGGDGGRSASGFGQQLEISNIVFPGARTDVVSSLYGNGGFNRCFDKRDKSAGNRHSSVRYQPDVLAEFGPFLEFDRVAEYSPKIKRLLENVRKSEGVVLIYTRYLASGVIPIALALEHEGYVRYGGTRMLDAPDLPARAAGFYSIITGNASLTSDAQRKLEIAVAKSKDNAEGDKIKIILVNEAAAEGLDFKAVREIHIMTPWANMNLLEQIIGRGVRNGSHMMLPPEKRNTSIFQYCNMIPGERIESIDFRLYRTSEVKQLRISAVERVMKQHAVDCVLNRSVVMPEPEPPRKMTTSQGKAISFQTGDLPFTRACDYQECDRTCIPDTDIKGAPIVLTKESMLSYEKSIYIRLIGDVFESRSGLSYKQVARELSKFGEIHPTLLKFALRTMVSERTPFSNASGRQGYLLFRSDLYWFQPHDIADRKLLNRERVVPKVKMTDGVPITKIPPPEPAVGQAVAAKDRPAGVEELAAMYDDMIAAIGVDTKKRGDTVVWDMLADRMPLDMIKAIAAQEAPFSPEVTKAIQSLQRGFRLWQAPKFVYQYETGKFLVPLAGNAGGWAECSPAEKRRFQDTLIADLENQLRGASGVQLRGLMDINKGEPKFKIVDQNKQSSPIKNGRVGSVCVQTSGFSIDDTKAMIMAEVHRQLGPSQAYPWLEEGKRSKSQLCDIYEYWLRRSKVVAAADAPVTFMRPAVFALYKEHVA